MSVRCHCRLSLTLTLEDMQLEAWKRTQLADKVWSRAVGRPGGSERVRIECDRAESVTV